jgi:K+-transporting ATPase ATPase C chain
MKLFLISLRMLAFMTLLTGFMYPFVVTAISQILFPLQANGSLVKKDNAVIGSNLLAQKFESDRYFWSRPSATDYNTLPSGGSNLSPTSTALKTQYHVRIEALKKKHDPDSMPPQDLLFNSASGLDPEISIEAAEYQINRIAQNRAITVIAVRHIIDELTQPPQFGILGESRVNVLKLNLDLDRLQK